jgi:acyl-CoA reductase-like NAD-dependent aldehyde dehydrogenase
MKRSHAHLSARRSHLYHHAGWAALMSDEMKGWAPIGVIGEIVPWNFPLMLLAWKVRVADAQRDSGGTA